MSNFVESVVAQEWGPRFIAYFDRLKDLLCGHIGVVQREDTTPVDDFMQDNRETVDIAFLGTLNRWMRITNDLRGRPEQRYERERRG